MPLSSHLKIPKLSIGQRITDEDSKPTPTFVRYINDMNSNISGSFNGLSDLVAQIALALEQAGIALDTANETKAKTSLADSYTVPGAVLTASVSVADPTKATITIAGHDRNYGDGSHVAVTGGSIDLLTQSTAYYIYYDDAARAGGTETYHASTDYLDAGQLNDRHSVGAVTTPGPGGPDVGGGGPRPPGTGPYLEGELP